MFSEKNIPKLIVISPIIAIFLVTFFTSYLFINMQYAAFDEESTKFEKEFIKNKKDALKNELESIYKYLEHQESIFTDDATQKVIEKTFLLKNRLIQLQKDLHENNNRDKILKNIVNSSNGDNNYFFAYDVKNSSIIQPDGKDIKKEFYEDGKFFENYLYSEKGKLIPFSKKYKIIYLQYIPDLDWIIGNIEDIDKNINFIRKVSYNYISSIKFDEMGYAWIMDDKSNIINEENYSIQNIREKALDTEEGFFINYTKRKTDVAMLSYVKYFEKWDLVIGTTLNLDYIKKSISLEKENLKKLIEIYIISIITLSIIVMISITIISIIISNKISNSFKLYRRNDIEQKDKLLNLNKNLEQKIQIRIHEAQIKDRAMLHQSRLARLGTMISMIAHQWRQPLTELSMILAELETATEFDKINKNMIFDSIHDSNKLLSYMSNTIDDFRMYFKPDKEKVKFSLQKVCNDAISLMKGTFKELDINLEKNFETDAIVEGYPREFSQVILNLLMNAKDMFLHRNIKNARIEFLISKRGKETYIIVRDNAGGVDPENLDKVFEPYFSTKKSNDNTGLGLFMSKMIIEKNMDGRLSVFNVPNGAEFNIVVLG